MVISTSIGSAFLDKKKKTVVSKNTTVSDIKQFLQQKFPGSPPADLQRLYFGTRLLQDSEVVSNITSLPTVPLLLDMAAGYSVYDKSMSVTAALEAYTATVVQLSYISNQMRRIVSNEPSDEMAMESPSLRRLLQSLNGSLWATYSQEIALALQAERDPETITADTKAWRDAHRKAASPLSAALAKEFDLNARGLRAFAYYSAILLVSNSPPISLQWDC